MAGTNLHAIIPAGGAGTRLWPLSRADAPKFLADLNGAGRSLLQQTSDRLAPLSQTQIIVTGRRHAPAVLAQIEDAEAAVEVVAEPSPRDSMAAIGLAAAIVERRDGDAIVGSFAADHVIGDQTAFEHTVRQAIGLAQQDYLVTIGVQPTSPSTAFGYIHQGAALTPARGATGFEVRAFVEKPERSVAEAYLASGEYRWNAGMFVCRATRLLDLLGQSDPEFARALREIAAQPHNLEARWEELPKIAIDHAIAEPAAAAGQVAMVAGAFDWRDVGDYAALRELAESTVDGVDVVGSGGCVIALDSSGLVVTGERPIAILGLSDVVVVDSPDGLLVTNLDQSQRVKDLVEKVKQTRPDLA